MKHYLAQIRPQDLRLAVAGAGKVVLFRVEPYSYSFAFPAAPSGPLVASVLGDFFNRKPLDVAGSGVPAHPRSPRVHAVFNSRNCEGGFGDIGRDDDAALGVGGKNAPLIAGAQAGKEGEDLYFIFVSCRQRPFYGIGKFLNLPLPGSKDQDVSRGIKVDFFHYGPGHLLGKVQIQGFKDPRFA